MLTQFQEHPDAWTRADAILEYAQVRETKCTYSRRVMLTATDLALTVLEKLIQTRWKILGRGQALGMLSPLQIIWRILMVLCRHPTLRRFAYRQKRLRREDTSQ